MSEHPWWYVSPRWFEWSTDAPAWKAFLGFVLPMQLMTTAVVCAVTYGLVWSAWTAAEWAIT